MMRAACASPAERILIGPGRSAFRSGDLVIRETVYGIVKRLGFFVDAIERYRRARGVAPERVRVLDLGCGTGVNVAIPLACAGYDVLGIDADLASVQRGRDLSTNVARIHFAQGDLTDVPVGKPFDVAICAEVLEHVEDTPAVLTALATVVAPGGVLLITLPNPFGFFEIDSLVWRALSRTPGLVQRLYWLESWLANRYAPPDLLARRQNEYEPKRLERTWSTLAVDQGHAHALSHTALSIDRLRIQLEDNGWRVLEQRNNTFLAGNLIGFCVRELDAVLAMNAKLADFLPSGLVSDWMLAAERCGPSAE